MTSERPAQRLVDRTVLFAVLVLPAAFLWAHGAMRGRDPAEVVALAHAVNWIVGAVLVGFSLAALLRRGHGTARMMALGCLGLAVAGLASVREMTARAATTEALALARRAEEVAAAQSDVVLPVRVVTVLLAAFAAHLFVRAARAGAWSLSFAVAGAILAVDVALIAVLWGTALGS